MRGLPSATVKPSLATFGADATAIGVRSASASVMVTPMMPRLRYRSEEGLVDGRGTREGLAEVARVQK